MFNPFSVKNQQKQKGLSPLRKSLFPKAGNAGDRDRTGTKCYLRRILSPVRLPVPPLRREGDTQIRTGGEGFAVLCLTTWLCRRKRLTMRYNDIYYSRAVSVRQRFCASFYNNFSSPAQHLKTMSAAQRPASLQTAADMRRSHHCHA